MKPSTHGDYQLSPRQRRILPLLVIDTQEHACKTAGVARSTLFEWFKDEAFTNALQEARDELFKSAMGEAQGNARKGRKEDYRVNEWCKKRGRAA